MSENYSKILCLDFDGVLHSYTSGWHGMGVVKDLPSPDAMRFLYEAVEYFDVHIYSSRSRSLKGRRAMKRWLRFHLINAFGHDRAKRIMKQIKWPWFKPPAFVGLDDRVVQYKGSFPSARELFFFKPFKREPRV